MSEFELPHEVTAVFQHFRSCEFATIGKDGTPIAWPMTVLYLPEKAQFFLATSIGYPQKVYNIRRNQRVSLLFSDPTGSELVDAPVVLVQGEAFVPDEVITWSDDLERLWTMVMQRQPAGNQVISEDASWYYMRLVIYVTPRRIRWWPEGDCTQQARETAVPDVV